MSTDLALRFLRACTQHRDEAGQPQQFDTTTLSALRDVRAAPGRVTAVLPVTPSVSNRYGTLHGGCIATLIDTVGSAALVTVSPKGGVSLNININYLSKLPLGGDVLVEAQVVKRGKTIATIDVQLRDAVTREMMAQGTHVKFIAESEPPMEELLKRPLKEVPQRGGGPVKRQSELDHSSPAQQQPPPVQQQQLAAPLPGVRSKL